MPDERGVVHIDVLPLGQQAITAWPTAATSKADQVPTGVAPVVRETPLAYHLVRLSRGTGNLGIVCLPPECRELTRVGR